MTLTRTKKAVDRSYLEKELIARVRAVDGCQRVERVTVASLQRPALSNWTVTEYEMEERIRSYCVRKLAQIMAEMQCEYVLREPDTEPSHIPQRE